MPNSVLIHDRNAFRQAGRGIAIPRGSGWQWRAAIQPAHAPPPICVLAPVPGILNAIHLRHPAPLSTPFMRRLKHSRSTLAEGVSLLIWLGLIVIVAGC